MGLVASKADPRKANATSEPLDFDRNLRGVDREYLGSDARQVEERLAVLGGLTRFPFRPHNVLPNMHGRIGFSVSRTLVTTALLAGTLAIMRAVPSTSAAALVIPLWCAAAGMLCDGKRGALRFTILAVVYPVYTAALFLVGYGIFWLYMIIHTGISGDRILW